MVNTIAESDKSYWHQYIAFYEAEFATLDCRQILEFGVFQGASIRWLMNFFPAANICGVDILPDQPNWPQDERVRYVKADQADVRQIKNVFSAAKHKFDLVIEDGSHLPEHQRNCLVESIRHIRPGGIYILEDIHTSHPNHPYYRKAKPIFKPLIGPLHLLLAIDHLKSKNGNAHPGNLVELTLNSLFSVEDVEALYQKIDSVKIFKRTRLPQRCFSCGGSDYSYAKLKCMCGVSLYAETDSMSALIRVN